MFFFCFFFHIFLLFVKCRAVYSITPRVRDCCNNEYTPARPHLQTQHTPTHTHTHLHAHTHKLLMIDNNSLFYNATSHPWTNH